MTMNSSCFWSLLSMDNLKFLYIPLSIGNIKISPITGQSIGDILLHRSLFEFMHPNEIELAKSDLSSFLQLRSLAGSVTRCQLLSFKSIATASVVNNDTTPQHYDDMQSSYFKSNTTSATNQKDVIWNIVDLVIYTAADDTVLAFFHNIDFESYYQDNNNVKPSQLSCCQGQNNFVTEDAMQLIQILKQKTTTTNDEGGGQDKDASILPLRIFQIVDQLNGSPLFMWPPPFQRKSANFIELVQSIAKEMVLKEFKSSSFDDKQHEDISCTRHFYASAKLDFLKDTCLFQRILIPYGNVVFESFQVSPVAKLISSSSSRSPLYQHYFMNPAETSITGNSNNMVSNTPTTNTSANTSSTQSPINYDYIGEKNYTYYNNSNSNNSKPVTTASMTDELIVAEVESQIPTLSLRVVEEERLVKQQQQQQYYLQNMNNNAATTITSPSTMSSCSLFQKFRVQQHQEGICNNQRPKTTLYYSTMVEKKRRILFNNNSQHHLRLPLLENSGVNITTNMQQQQPQDISGGIKVCSRCRTSNSPEWRRGPDGHKTLCNACGLRYSRFRSKQWRSTSTTTTK